MGNDVDIMRILGNIEGKIDGLLDNNSKLSMRLDQLHADVQVHKQDDARDKNRVIGAMTVLGMALSAAWALITFFGTSIAKAFHQ